MNVIQSLGFATMTPVQAAVIPLFLNRKDVVVEAVTGSGKSLAFIIPIVDMLLESSANVGTVQALIISPTRELASQLHRLLLIFCNDNGHAQLKSMLVTGGRPLAEDVKEMQQLKPSIVVATPGKLEELIKQQSVIFKQLEVLVLDEADRLLDLGFEKQLHAIMQHIPKQRRTGLFSATITDAVSELMKMGMRNPVRVVVKVENKQSHAVQRTPSSLSIEYRICDAANKFKHMLSIVSKRPREKLIVYFATCYQVEYFYKVLQQLPCVAITKFYALHGKMDSDKRPRVLKRFYEPEPSVLLCTDVAARGIDFPDVDYILQYDPPQDPQAFLHRCGRTARSGRIGKAMVLLMPHEDTFVEYLTLKKVPIAANDLLFDEALLASVPVVEMPGHYLDHPTDLITRYVHHLVLKDRALFDLQVRAFVSYIKSYQEHQLKFIFPFAKLPLDGVMSSFMLITDPKCPELKQWRMCLHGVSSFRAQIASQSLSLIPYADKVREAKRQSLLAAPAEPKRHKSRAAWSQQKELKEKRTERHTKKDRKRKAVLLSQMAALKEQEAVAADQQIVEEMDDWRQYKNESKSKKRSKLADLSDVDL